MYHKSFCLKYQSVLIVRTGWVKFYRNVSNMVFTGSHRAFGQMSHFTTYLSTNKYRNAMFLFFERCL